VHNLRVLAQELASSVLEQTSRARREAAALKERDDKWMKVRSLYKI
jgi:hypothetical protein